MSRATCPSSMSLTVTVRCAMTTACARTGCASIAAKPRYVREERLGPLPQPPRYLHRRTKISLHLGGPRLASLVLQQRPSATPASDDVRTTGVTGTLL